MSAKKPAKPNKASQSRRDALKAQRLAEARRRRQNRIIAVIAGVVALAVVVGVSVWALNRKPPEEPATTTSPGEVEQVAPPNGNSQRAWITLPGGNPKPDALIVDVQFDYQCPYCGMVENAFATSLEALSERGDIVVRNHTRIFLDRNLQNDSSERSAVAAACVDVADETKYAAYHNQIFLHQPQKEGTGYTDAQLTVDFPAAVGLTGEALATFNTCYANRATLQFVRDVEQNNLAAKQNSSPPNAYLFGGAEPNKDDAEGRCSGTPNGPVGACGTPDFYSGGVRFRWSDLLNTDYSPKVDNTNPDALLQFLLQVAQS